MFTLLFSLASFFIAKVISIEPNINKYTHQGILNQNYLVSKNTFNNIAAILVKNKVPYFLI